MDVLSLAAAAAIPVALFVVYAVLRSGIRVLTRRPGRRRAHMAPTSGQLGRPIQPMFEPPPFPRASPPILSKVAVSRPAAPAPNIGLADRRPMLARDLVAVGPGRDETHAAPQRDVAVAPSRAALAGARAPVQRTLGRTSSRPVVEPEWPSHAEFPYVHVQLPPGDEESADSCPVCAESRARGARFCRRCGRPVIEVSTQNGRPAASRRGLGLLRGSLGLFRSTPKVEATPAVGPLASIGRGVTLDELSTLAGVRDRTARPDGPAQPAFASAGRGVRGPALPEAPGGPTNGDRMPSNGTGDLDFVADAAWSVRTPGPAPDAPPARAERVPVLHVKARVAAGHGPDRAETDSKPMDSPAAAPLAVDLNRATVAELVTLPGIGQATAQRIVASRKELPFPSIEALKERRVLGAAALAKIRDLVEVR